MLNYSPNNKLVKHFGYSVGLYEGQIKSFEYIRSHTHLRDTKAVKYHILYLDMRIKNILSVPMTCIYV